MTSTPVGAIRTVQRSCGLAALDVDAHPLAIIPSRISSPHSITLDANL
ncbi:MAG TPA: hypothetical protein VHR15_19910 [Ktedonobacterales bacterium]|jgi:hypothetical protein|nr:hypothetical protein [Ktedonobacterales bacterium]